eukprot:3780089-Rhodomonas_salina.6
MSSSLSSASSPTRPLNISSKPACSRTVLYISTLLSDRYTVDSRKFGPATGTVTAVKASVARSSIAIQFQETVEDYLENQSLSVLTMQMRKRQEGLFQKLSGLRREIDEFLHGLLISEAWLVYQEYLLP